MTEQTKKPDAAVDESAQVEVVGGDTGHQDVASADDTTAKKKKKKKNKKAEQKKGELGSSRGIETMFRTSYRTNMDLSSLADTKANIMISINGIIISIILASISPKIDTNPWLLIPTAVLLLSCLISIVLCRSISETARHEQ